MRTKVAAVLAGLAFVAACGPDVPAGLADKVESACPGLLKAEPLAVITKGLTVSQVESAGPDGCRVFVSTGQMVLSLGLVAYPSQEESERLTPMLCASGTLDPETRSCEAGQPDSKELSVHAVAGRWNVRVHVYEVPVDDEIKAAVQRIIEDLRSSDKVKNA